MFEDIITTMRSVVEATEYVFENEGQSRRIPRSREEKATYEGKATADGVRQRKHGKDFPR